MTSYFFCDNIPTLNQIYYICIVAALLAAPFSFNHTTYCNKNH